jgi:hypothetical protein
MTVILENGWYVPVPENYTVESVVEILRKYSDHAPVLVRDAEGNETPVEKIEEAA